MKPYILPIAIVAIVIGFSTFLALDPDFTRANSDVSGADAAWLTDFQQAKQRSAETGKSILANFTGSDWCKYCVALEDKVFSKPHFKTWAEQNVILLKIDFPKHTQMSSEQRLANEKLAGKYSIRGFPTILFLDSSGSRLGRSGYLNGDEKFWTDNATKILAKANALPNQ